MADTSAWAPTVTPAKRAPSVVTDPVLIGQLNALEAAPPAQASRATVTDPGLIAELEAAAAAERPAKIVTDPTLIAELDNAAAAQQTFQEIKAPNGDIVRFPAGTSDDVITNVMRQEYGGPDSPAASPSLMDRVVGPRPAGPNPDPNAPLNLSEWLFGGPEFDARRKSELARSQQGAEDVVRVVNQGATLGYQDEIVAWLKSKFGNEAYDKALAEERAHQRETEERAGTVGTVAGEVVGSMALPVGTAVKAYNALAPAGSGLARKAGALATTSYPINVISAYGHQEDKDAGNAAVAGGIASTAAIPLAVGLHTGARLFNAAVAEPYRRLSEWLRLRAGNPIAAESSTQQYAVRKIADAANEGGIVTTQDLSNAMRANQVPFTDMTLVNSGNDRISQLALEQARQLARPHLPMPTATQQGSSIAEQFDIHPEIWNSATTRPPKENVWEGLAARQAESVLGQPQAEALVTRIHGDFHIPLRERDPVNVAERANAEIERQGNRIADLRNPVMGQQIADTPLPGFVGLLDSDPAAASAYRRATTGVSLPGQASVPRDLLPLHGREYQRALADWEARRDAAAAAGRQFTDPAPIQLTDTNVPVSVLQNMLADASATTQSDDAIKRNLGINLHRVLTDLTERSPMGTPARQLREANRSIGVTRTAQEDLAAGRRMPTQDAGALTGALAEHSTLPADRQLSRRRGYVQGLVDEINANTDNIGSIPGTILTDPLRREAYDTVARAGSTAPVAQDLAREVSNVGNMQDVSAGLIAASRGREPSDSLPEQIARAYVGWNFSPTVGVARIASNYWEGLTQARRGEIARLLVDTSGQGTQLLQQELSRRVAGYTKMTPPERSAFVMELARQLSDGSAQMME